MDTFTTLDTDCPVCLSPITPPTYQCSNGHLICGECLSILERQPPSSAVCPACRVPYTVGRRIRNLVADALSARLFEEKVGALRPGERRTGEELEGAYVNMSGKPLRVAPRPTSFASLCVLDLEGEGEGEGEDEGDEGHSLGCGGLDIAETRVVAGQVVGRLSAMGPSSHHKESEAEARWVRLTEAETGRELVHGPVRTGVYRLLPVRGKTAAVYSGMTGDVAAAGAGAGAGAAAGAKGDLPPSLALPRSTYVQIVETRFSEADGCVRGRLSTGGWVALLARRERGRRQQLGDRAEGGVGEGKREGGVREEEDGVGAACGDNGGERGERSGDILSADGMPQHCMLVPVAERVLRRGAYRTIARVPLWPSAAAGGGSVSTAASAQRECAFIPPGQYLQIERVVLSAVEGLVRGKLATAGPSGAGGWINMYTTSGGAGGGECVGGSAGSRNGIGSGEDGEDRDGMMMADGKGAMLPSLAVVPHGTYVVVAEDAGVTRDAEHTSALIAYLFKAARVEVVETVYQPLVCRVRGRIKAGGWLSLVDTGSGFVWAVAEVEAAGAAKAARAAEAAGAEKAAETADAKVEEAVKVEAEERDGKEEAGGGNGVECNGGNSGRGEEGEFMF